MLWMWRYAEKMLLIFNKTFLQHIRAKPMLLQYESSEFQPSLKAPGGTLVTAGNCSTLDSCQWEKTALSQTSLREAFHRRNFIKVTLQHSLKVVTCSELIDFDLSVLK